MKIAAVVLVALLLTGCGNAEVLPDAPQSQPVPSQAANATNPAPSILLDNSAALLAIARADLQAQITLNASYTALLKAAESRQNQAIAEAATLRVQLTDYNWQVANARTYQALADNLTGELAKAKNQIAALTANTTGE